MRKRTVHDYTVQNNKGKCCGKSYRKTTLKAFGSNIHDYSVQNNKGSKVGKRVTRSSEQA